MNINPPVVDHNHSNLCVWLMLYRGLSNIMNHSGSSMIIHHQTTTHEYLNALSTSKPKFEFTPSRCFPKFHPQSPLIPYISSTQSKSRAFGLLSQLCSAEFRLAGKAQPGGGCITPNGHWFLG